MAEAQPGLKTQREREREREREKKSKKEKEKERRGQPTTHRMRACAQPTILRAPHTRNERDEPHPATYMTQEERRASSGDT